MPQRIVTIRDDEIVVGPTGKVRKFLMRQRLLEHRRVLRPKEEQAHA